MEDVDFNYKAPYLLKSDYEDYFYTFYFIKAGVVAALLCAETSANFEKVIQLADKYVDMM